MLSFQNDEQSARPKFKNLSEHLRNLKPLFCAFGISWFLCLLKNFSKRTHMVHAFGIPVPPAAFQVTLLC